MPKKTARELLEWMDYKSKFVYRQGMELEAAESDRRSSMDKIAVSFRNEEVVLSDLYIAYVVSLYQYTIPPVIAATVQVFGRLWPDKHIPSSATREELLSRLKRMCGMGMLRRYGYELEGQRIVLYTATVEVNKIIYQLLKYHTDARAEKELLPPIEIMGITAASLVAAELMQSNKLQEFHFKPTFLSDTGERYIFYAEFYHQSSDAYVTIVQPVFTQVDQKRYTAPEWEAYQKHQLQGLCEYIAFKKRKHSEFIQLIIVIQDKQDFLRAFSWILELFPQEWLESVFYTSEGLLKNEKNLKQCLIKGTKILYEEKTQQKRISAITSQLPYEFF